MSWIKDLFSDTNTLNKIVDKGIEIIDESFHTKEEKAVERRKLIEMLLTFMEKTKYMSLARRVLAFLIVSEYIILINVAVIGLALGCAEFADTIFSDILLGRLQMLVNIVVGFYFATGLLKGTGIGK